MKLKLKKAILHYVRLDNGISNLKLSLSVMGFFGPMSYLKSEYDQALEELLQEKEIIKIEFTNPESSKDKTIYFLKGTTFKLIATRQEIPVEITSDNNKNQLVNKGN